MSSELTLNVYVKDENHSDDLLGSMKDTIASLLPDGESGGTL
jgi:hypothetical protein